MTQLASNIQKGGALLDDTRRFVEVLDPTLSAAENLDQILDANLLAKASRSRLEDVLARILVPRFIDPGEQIMAALRHLLTFPHAFREACYFETTRDDTLLAAFAEGPLFEWYHSGRTTIPIEDVKGWLGHLHGDGQIPSWSESVRTKTARGLPMFTAKESKKDLVVLKKLFEAGKVTPVVDRTYPLSEVPEAIRYLEEGHARGEVVITI